MAHTISNGYPFLVQCIAHAAFIEGDVIDDKRVIDTLEAALENGSGWLARECAAASDGDIIAFAKIARSGKSNLRSSEMRDMGIIGPYIGRLVTNGVLHKVSRGRYELRKAPVIAYYHLLKRNISIEADGSQGPEPPSP